jgi:hypothetical protein
VLAHNTNGPGKEIIYVKINILLKMTNTEAGILVENFHRQGRALKSTLNFIWQNSMPFSDRDRSLKQVRTLGSLKFRPLYEYHCTHTKIN